jgi:hypothetical protein
MPVSLFCSSQIRRELQLIIESSIRPFSFSVVQVAAAVATAPQLGLPPHPLINPFKLAPQQRLLPNNHLSLPCNNPLHPVPAYLAK